MTATENIDAFQKAWTLGSLTVLRIDCSNFLVSSTIFNNRLSDLIVEIVLKRLVEDLGFRNRSIRVLLGLPVSLMTDWAFESASFLV